MHHFSLLTFLNMGLNKWQVVITSGNENKNKDVTVSKRIVTRNELSAKKELQYESFRNSIKMKRMQNVKLRVVILCPVIVMSL